MRVGRLNKKLQKTHKILTQFFPNLRRFSETIIEIQRILKCFLQKWRSKLPGNPRNLQDWPKNCQKPSYLK